MILNGRRNGTWTGWYPNGEMHYREEYDNGAMVRGRSRNPEGATFIYDQSTYFPLPEGGYDELKRVLDAAAQSLDRPHIGTVHVYFRVTFDGLLTDFEFEKDVSPEVKGIVKGLLLEGPEWRPARESGLLSSGNFCLRKCSANSSEPSPPSRSQYATSAH